MPRLGVVVGSGGLSFPRMREASGFGVAMDINVYGGISPWRDFAKVLKRVLVKIIGE